MVGEKFTLTLNFTYENLEEYEVEEPQFENFESKLLEDNESQESNGTWQVIQCYELTPSRAGHFELSPLKTHIEMIEEQYQERYNRNKYLKKIDIFTKPIEIEVQALPEGVRLTGKYELSATVDKNVTKFGEPIHFSVKLKGEGNLANLDFLTLNIPHTTVYEKVNTQQEKSFDILANESFTIPPIVLKYYNQKREEIDVLTTPLFKIEVVGGVKEKSVFQSYWWLLLLLLLPFWFLILHIRKDERTLLRRELKRCKSREELLKKLMPYFHKNRRITRLIYQLEEVESRDFKKLKRKILRYF